MIPTQMIYLEKTDNSYLVTEALYDKSSARNAFGALDRAVEFMKERAALLQSEQQALATAQEPKKPAPGKKKTDVDL